MSEEAKNGIPQEDIDEMREEMESESKIDIHFDHTLNFFRSSETDKLTAALVAARKKFVAVDRSGKVDYPNKNQKGEIVGRTKYPYSTKDDMIKATKDGLGTNGLIFSCLTSTEPTRGKPLMATVIVRASMKHISGQEEGVYLSSLVRVTDKQKDSDFLKAKMATATSLWRLAYSTLTGLSGTEPGMNEMTQEDVDQHQGESAELIPAEEAIDYNRANQLQALAGKKGMSHRGFLSYVTKRTDKDLHEITVGDADMIEKYLNNKKDA